MLACTMRPQDHFLLLLREAGDALTLHVLLLRHNLRLLTRHLKTSCTTYLFAAAHAYISYT